MSAVVEYLSNNASEAEIAEHLLRCNAAFLPPLSDRVDIDAYAHKITSKASRFEAWSGGALVGLVAAYFNDRQTRIAFITSISVLANWKNMGIATRLVEMCIEHAKVSGMRQIRLEVERGNSPAIALYRKSGFVAGSGGAPIVCMTLHVDGGDEHE